MYAVERSFDSTSPAPASRIFRFTVARRRATTYDKTIEVMHDALNGANIGRSEKVHAFHRLAEIERRGEDMAQTSIEGMQ